MHSPVHCGTRAAPGFAGSEPDGHPFDASGSSIEQRTSDSTRSLALVLQATCTILRQSRLPIGLRWWQSHQQRSLRPRRHLCITAYAGWLTVLVRQHPREVSPLSRGVMLQPLSGPLQAGFRLLPRPLPAAPSAPLAARFPLREDYGLTTFRRSSLGGGLGRVSTPVGPMRRSEKGYF